MNYIAGAGGRTFALTVGCGLVTTIALWFDHLDSGAYSAIILGTVGVYITANAYQKGVEINANKELSIASGASPPVPLSPSTPPDAR